MAKALVAKNEIVFHYDGSQIGLRIVDVFDSEFFTPEENHFWVDCLDGLDWSHFYYNESTKAIEEIPVNPEWAIQTKMRQEYEAKRKTATISTGAIIV